jgi:hypothetical protein
MAVRHHLHFIMWRYYGPEFPENRENNNLRLGRKDIDVNLLVTRTKLL